MSEGIDWNQYKAKKEKKPVDWSQYKANKNNSNEIDDDEEELPLPEESTGLIGVGEDLLNAASAAKEFALDIPEKLEKSGKYIEKNPAKAVLHNYGQLAAGAADLGKSLVNAPHDLLKYLLKKNLAFDIPIPGTKLHTSDLIPHIPEDLGIEKTLGLEADPEKGDELIRAIPNAVGTGLGGASLVKKIKNIATKPSKEKLFQRALENKVEEAAKKVGMHEDQLKAFQDALKLEYSEMFPEQLGEVNPVSLQEKLNIKKQKLEANPKKNEIPEGELPEIPEKPDTKAMLEEHKELIDKAKQEAEATVGIKTNPGKEAGRSLQKSIEDLEESSGKIYNAARDYYKEKNISADNSAEIKQAAKELEKLSANEEFYEGDSSKRTELLDTIKALENEKVKATDIFTAMRTSQQLAAKARMKRKGATEAEWNRLTAISDKLEGYAEKLANRLEEVGGQDVSSMIKEANKGYRTFKELTVGKFHKGIFKTNPVAKEAFKTGNVTSNAMLKLADDLPGNEFLNTLVKSDSELRKNLLATYSGESNINKLTNPNTLTKKYLESLPEVEDKLNAFQKAISDYKGKEKEATKIEKAHEELVTSMKNVAEAKKLQQQIEFHEKAIPKVEAKMKNVNISKEEHAKLAKELKDHKKHIADKNHLLKKYGPKILTFLGVHELAKKYGV